MRGARAPDRQRHRHGGLWARLCLCLALLLQLGVPHAEAGAATVEPAALVSLGATLGHQVSICHHGDTGPSHPGSTDDACCAFCLCHVARVCVGLTPTAIILDPPRAVAMRPLEAAVAAESGTYPARHGPSPRGPPLAV